MTSPAIDHDVYERTVEAHQRALETKIDHLYDHLTRLHQAPEVLYKFDPDLKTLVVLYAPDLMPGVTFDGNTGENALSVLRWLFDLEGAPSIRLDALFVKHVLNSQIGKHCVVGSRQANAEELEKLFVVHFDHSGRAFMIVSTYHIGYPVEADMQKRRDPEYRARANQEVVSIVEGKTRIGRTRPRSQVQVLLEPVLVADHAQRVDRLVTRVKASDGVSNAIYHIDTDAKVVPVKSSRAGARPMLVAGHVYATMWDEEAPPENLRTVVLKDLESEQDMRGKFVAVFDYIAPGQPMEPFDDGAKPSFSTNTSVPDRLMAYYHVDLAQRYFRELGLSVLDQYSALNPIRVELGGLAQRTQYLPMESKLQFRKLGGASSSCTDARDPRLVYHEFTHAVTDALARLRRQDVAKKLDVRFKSVVQAHAMDEGMADYFACSLAARQGAKTPSIAPDLVIRQINGAAALVGIPQRHLVGQPPDLRIIDKDVPTVSTTAKVNGQDIPVEAVDDEVLYQWGNQWARFLWCLRDRVGDEIADRLVANSIFFLHRWATFEQGVLALIVADKLLFDGLHRTAILQDCHGEDVRAWKTAPVRTVSVTELPAEDVPAGAAFDYSFKG